MRARPSAPALSPLRPGEPPPRARCPRAEGAAIALALALVGSACGDDTGGGGGAGGGGTSGAGTTTSAASTTAAGPTTGAATTSSSSSSSSGSGGAGGDGGGGGAGGVEPFVPACPDVELDEEDLGAGDDPTGGVFTLEEALADLPEGDGALRAMITTEHGTLSCELFPDVAPNGVANFVGLARGTRPFLDPETNTWVRGRRFYDGLLFHRVIDDFVAQGGDPLGTGFGGPGYEFEDEIGELSHVPGTLAYANAGADTNGSQFYVVAEEPAAFLDGDYTIFGLCEPVSVAKALTEVQTGLNDRPVQDLVMQVHISRCEG